MSFDNFRQEDNRVSLSMDLRREKKNAKEEVKINLLPVKDILDYEVKASWWASKISNNWLQGLAGSYFANKVRRKYNRYVASTIGQKNIQKL